MSILPHAALIKEAYRKKAIFKKITSRSEWWDSLTEAEKSDYLNIHLTVAECFELFAERCDDISSEEVKKEERKSTIIKEECFGTFSNIYADEKRTSTIKEEYFGSLRRKLEKKN